jgi:hypothetical protein
MHHRNTSLLALSGAIALALATAAGAQTITTPKDHFGFNMGDDYQLATYTQFEAYWRALDAESDRMKLVEIGRTAEGRPQLMAIITSPANHQQLEKYRDISRRLAYAEGLTDEAARALAREGKGVVWFDGGLHSTEVLGATQLVETVYQLVSRNDPETLRFLDDSSSSPCTPTPTAWSWSTAGTCASRSPSAARRRACRASTRSTSATTTTATSTCRRSPRART